MANKPKAEKLRAQTKALLKAWQDASTNGLTTRQLQNFTYLKTDKKGTRMANVGDWRSRKSELKKVGWLFQKKACGEGFNYVLSGFQAPVMEPVLPGLEAAA